MQHRESFLKALGTAAPAESLRNLVQQLAKEGCTKIEVVGRNSLSIIEGT
jgi:hypothetical protein